MVQESEGGCKGCGGAGGCGERGAPEEVADQVVFADVVREEIDAFARVRSGGVEELFELMLLGLCLVRMSGGLLWLVFWVAACEQVEVRAPEHVGFAEQAGGDGDGVDGRVEFGVGGGHEHLFKVGT